MPGERRQARIVAMQALCQWDVQRDESSEGLGEFLEELGATPVAATYATGIVNEFWNKPESVDKRIADATERWSLERISTVERNVMRVAVVELVRGEVPPRAVLDEAIEIAREYGGEDSSRFVNGVLDRILTSLTQEERNNG